MAKVLFLSKRISVVEPLGILYLSASLKKDGHDVLLADTTKVDIKKTIEKYEPHIIGYSSLTGAHVYYIELDKQIKSWFPGIFTIMGGSHPTFWPKQTLIRSTINAICVGEGDNVLPDLLAGVDVPLGIGVRHWDAPGYKYKGPGRLSLTPDEYPFPDRELLYAHEKYRNNYMFNVMTSRGCVGKCRYCFNHAFYNKVYNMKCQTVRFRSPENVLEEIIQVRSFYPNKTFLFFQDDCFTLKPSRFYKIMKLYTKEFKRTLPFHCQVRPDMINEEMIIALKQGGCKSVTMAFESGNEQYRKEKLGRGMTNKQMIEAAELLHKYDIRFRIENMVGLPFETLDNALETLDLNIKAKPCIGWSSLFSPYPGTDLGDDAQKAGLWDGNYDSIDEGFFGRSVLKMKDKNKFVRLQKIFSIIVSYPQLRKYVRFLISLPLTNIYSLIYKKFKTMKYNNELY